jgi:hypothetical protein
MKFIPKIQVPDKYKNYGACCAPQEYVCACTQKGAEDEFKD